MLVITFLAIILGIAFAAITYFFIPNVLTFLFMILVAVVPLIIYIAIKNNVFKIGFSIKTKLFVFFVIVALVPAIPIMFIAHHILKSSIKKFTNDLILEPIELSVENIKRYEDHISHIAKTDFNLLSPRECKNFGNIIVLEIKTKDKILCYIKYLKVSDEYIVYKNNFYKTIEVNKNGITYLIGFHVFTNIDRWKDKLSKALVFLKSERWKGENLEVVLNIFFVIFALLIFIFSVFFAIAVTHNILSPIEELKLSMKEIASGNWDKKIEIKPVKELVDFVNTFNHMIDELNKYRENLKRAEKLAAWREVAQRVAHEIKNPLTPIQLSAERIKRKFYSDPEGLEKVIKDSVNTIVDSVNILKSMVNEFSEFAKLPSAKLSKNNLNSIIEDVLKGYPSNEKIEFKTALDSSIPELYLDEKQIKRLLINLIQNSIAAIKDKGVIEIKTFYDKTKNKVLLIISDTGEGIPEELKEKIFEPYFTTKKYGTGLGLAIVEHIVREHFAKIYFESEKGKGTKFFIEFEVKGNV